MSSDAQDINLAELLGAPDTGEPHPQITCRLAELLEERGMTLTTLSRRTGITMANLSILKNNHAKAVRMNTLAAICRELGVTPGDILVLED